MVCKACIPQETIRMKAKNFTESTTDVLKSTRRTEIQLHYNISTPNPTAHFNDTKFLETQTLRYPRKPRQSKMHKSCATILHIKTEHSRIAFNSIL